ncbi:MAG: endo alpha-1,4 polygalactosaminidase [Nannocystaceae bacterium]|nr:endo alpha-1,4 polygalactosaminidase [Nannocystaceae bacterium]
MTYRAALALASGLVVPGCSTVEGQDDADNSVTIGGMSGDDGGTSNGTDDELDTSDPGASSGPATTGEGADDGSEGSDGEDEGLDGDSTGERPPGTGLWAPQPGVTWQWQLTGAIDTSLNVDVYDIDLFDVGIDLIQQLHTDGRIVICYFSAGSYEEWRTDADQFPDTALGDPLDNWPGERWPDHRSPEVREIMAARLDLAVEKGCDAVEPDNVDGYANPNGVGLTGEDQLDYNRWLAQEAHSRGLSVGLKNDLDQLEALAGDFDWALNEECMQFEECALLQAPFIAAGKAVFHVEYVDENDQGAALAEQICNNANELQFSTIVKQWDLGPFGIPCWPQ